MAVSFDPASMMIRCIYMPYTLLLLGALAACGGSSPTAEGSTPDAPANLSEEGYFSILAFDLKANGIDLGDKKLDGALAQTLDIPRK